MKTLAILMFAACAQQAQTTDGVRVSAEFNAPPTRIFVTHQVATACKLSEVMETDLDKVASCLSAGALKGYAVQVTGKEGNNRADSVASYLSDKGVKSTQITTRPQGQDNVVSIGVN